MRAMFGTRKNSRKRFRLMPAASHPHEVNLAQSTDKLAAVILRG
jgi:hypothetical protein